MVIDVRCVLALGAFLSLAAWQPLVAQQPAEGRIAGVVRDASTGRPLPTASVVVVGTSLTVRTDVEGRFRTPSVAPGLYAVEVSLIGFPPTRVDSVSVAAGQVASVEVALSPRVIQIQGLVATGVAERASSSSGLLAVQRGAAVVTDGISAEQISRSPDSDAADAIARVTGVSVVDDKFVVVRGLTERYSNTLLNGVELASPEPTRRIVPLDLFPSSLLESVVAVKTATPDLPGDFAGGSVNIGTKDFPDQRVFEIKASVSANSLTTLENLPVFARNGFADMTGFDGGDRSHEPPSDLAERFAPGTATSLARSIRGVWTPDPRRVLPDLGLSIQYGDQLGQFERALGFVVSFDYGLKTGYEPAEYFAVLNRDGSPVIETMTEHATTTADWGFLGNASVRLGPSHTFSIKNLVTQESEEFVIVGQAAFNPDPEYNFGPLIHRYQVRYVERALWQTQLGGQHRFAFPFATSWEWTVTRSGATRDEPENRSLTYLNDSGTYRIDSWKPNTFWFRYLEDLTTGVNLDVSIPLGRWFDEAEGLLKVGGNIRRKHRDFDGYKFAIVPARDDPPDGPAALALPPEQIMAPENVGRNVRAEPGLPDGLPYSSDDDVTAAYVMGDVPLPGGLRFVGGLRMERWNLDMLNRQPPAGRDSVYVRDTQSLLLSGNLIYSLSERMNIRAAGYQTVSRPDPREIALGQYAPVAGKCTQSGNTDLKPASILNADLRWEWYPAAGEVISSSLFYKLFKDAIVESVSLTVSECETRPHNARTAYSSGAEIDFQKRLGFLGPRLENVLAGLNVTYARGQADLILGSALQHRLELQDLSKYVLNGSLVYSNAALGLSTSVLYSYFADRISLYGDINGNGDKTPDIIEEGRGNVDFKVSQRLGSLSLSLSGKNLTNGSVRETQMTDVGALPVAHSRIGTSYSLSIGYAF